MTSLPSRCAARVTLLLMSTTAAGLATPAAAQTSEQIEDAAEKADADWAAGRGAGRPEKVLVTGVQRGFVATQASSGTKTDTPLIETPQSVTVIPRAQLTQQDAHTLNEALRYTAGITTQTRGPSGSQFDELSFRGFGSISGVANTYLDGMKLLGNGSYITPQVDSYAVDRIEVLKGPASVLYGQSNPAGLINEVSKLPTAQPYHELGIEGGTFGRIQGTVDLSGPLDAGEHFLYRLTGLVRDGDGQVDHVKERRVLVRPSVSWVPDADTTFTLQGFYQRDPYGGYYGAFPQSGTLLYNPRGTVSRSFYDGDPNYEKYDRTQYGIGYQLEHRIGSNVTLRQKFRWLRVDGEYRSVYTTGLGFQTVTLPDNSLLYRGVIGELGGSDAFTVDNQASVTLHTGPVSHLLLAGLDYQTVTGRSVTRGDFSGNGAPPINIFAPVYGQRITTPPVYSSISQTLGQVGFYGQDQIRFGHLTLLGGGRYDLAATDTTNRLADSDSGRFDRKFTGRVGVIYDFANGLAPYASYSESFEPTTGTDFSGAGFKPTTGTQYEVGLKYQPPGWNTLLTAAAFQITQQNLSTRDPLHPNYSIQAGEGRSRGIELEAHASPLRGLDLVAAYTYLDAIYSKDNSGLQGNTFNAVPKHSVSGWGDYTLQSGRLVGFGFGGGVRFTGPMEGNDENTLNISQTTLFDATVHYDVRTMRGWLHDTQLYANATNLFDRRFIAGCYSQQWCYYGAQRTILGGVRAHW